MYWAGDDVSIHRSPHILEDPKLYSKVLKSKALIVLLN
jgi:hypothetical protein